MAEIESLAADEDLAHHLRRHGYDRLIMLSDGVFAIAITLAAIEVHLPTQGVDLQAILAGAHVSLLAYLVSFAVIASFWGSHRNLMARLGSVNKPLTWLVLAQLCAVSLIPAGTRELYESDGSAGALRFYALVMVVSGVINLAMWGYALLGTKLAKPGETIGERRVHVASTAFMPLLFAILLFSPQTGRGTLSLMLPFVALSAAARRLVLPRLARRSRASATTTP